MNESSPLVSKMLGILYPFILMFGFYIILNGHQSPGGGFQGGAVLSAVFITRYMIFPVQDIKINLLEVIEKVVYIFIILIPFGFLFQFLSDKYSFLNTFYLVVMNSLIGIKVACGFSIIFFRFVFYESR